MTVSLKWKKNTKTSLIPLLLLGMMVLRKTLRGTCTRGRHEVTGQSPPSRLAPWFATGDRKIAGETMVPRDTLLGIVPHRYSLRIRSLPQSDPILTLRVVDPGIPVLCWALVILK